jgi:hypothetical protein
MTNPEPDRRSENRKQLDEQIAAEPQLPLPELTSEQLAKPVEAHLRQSGPEKNRESPAVVRRQD